MAESKSQHIDVMISSTSKDLPEHRKAVTDAIWRAEMYPIGMERDNIPVHGLDAVSFSMQMVDAAEIYIGIFAYRYGYIPSDKSRNPTGISITEMEYRRAMDRGIPVLIFIMGENHPITARDKEEDPDAFAKLNKLKNELQARHIVGFFNSVDELREQANRALNKLRVSLPPPPIPTTASICPPQLYSKPAYILTNKFIGREAELKQIDDWSQADDVVLVVEAIGGLGKSALTWEWVNSRARQVSNFAGVFWWSFYEKGANIESFIRHALAYIRCIDPDDLKDLSFEDRKDQLLQELRRSRYLLAMDGLERILIAYHRLDKAHLQDNEVSDTADLRDCTNPRDNEFLQELVTIAPSKIVISSRLMPRALEDAGLAIPKVCQMKLGGLSPDDAVLLLKERGVRKGSAETIKKFLAQIEYHSLLVKVIAGVIYNYYPARGDFDTWHRNIGQRMSLHHIKEIAERRTKLLTTAFSGMETEENIDKLVILCRIAAFSNPVSYRMISMLNPYMPPRPSLPKLPPFPQTRPSPFGSPELAWLKFLYNRTRDIEKRNQLESEIAKQEALDEERKRYMERNAYRLERELERVREERAKLLAEYKRAYETSDTYLAAISTYDMALAELEERGLLQWDRENDAYDLHPVVRGHAFALLSGRNLHDTMIRIRDIFAATPELEVTEVQEVGDINDYIEMYRALVSAKEMKFAQITFAQKLGSILLNLGEYRLIIELLSGLLTNEFEVHPDVENSADVRNYLAIAFGQIGEIEISRKLYGQNLAEEIGQDRWSIYVAVVGYAERLLQYNSLSGYYHGIRLAADVLDENDNVWGKLDLFNYYIIIGAYEQAGLVLQAIGDELPIHFPKKFLVRRKVMELRYKTFTHSVSKQDFNDAYGLIFNEEAVSLANYHYIYALYCMEQGLASESRNQLQEALRVGQKMGRPVSIYWATLAFLTAKHSKNSIETKKYIARAMNKDKNLHGMRAEIYASLAQAYLELDIKAEAEEFARAALKYAVENQAEGLVLYRPLQLATDVLKRLGYSYQLQDRVVEKVLKEIPYEKEIYNMYLDKNNPAYKISAPSKKQAEFEFSKYSWIHLGTIALFGIDDDELRNEVALRLAKLSYIPGPIQSSRMGEEVPEPSSYEIAAERHTFGELEWEFRHSETLDKVFSIIYLESHDSQGEKIFAYVNCRGDRLENLLKQGESKGFFNLSTYATIIMTGRGAPTESDREKLRRDYLFGEHYTNVRIFPPLNQVT